MNHQAALAASYFLRTLGSLVAVGASMVAIWIAWKNSKVQRP
jgi:hypothetical protein